MRWSRRFLLVLLGSLLLASAAVGAPTPTHVHFAAAGDFNSTSATSNVLQAIGNADPDAFFALGDLSYGAVGAEQSWCDLVTSKVGGGFPFELLTGNHESNGLNGNINDFSACLPNQLPGVVGTYGRQYYVDVPQGDPLVRFVMISPGLTFPDGSWSYQAGSARYAWTAATIDGARSAGIPWVVVGMHKPCLSVGQYSCDVGADLVNLLLAKKVDLVLSGHEHSYQRTKQLSLGSGCASLSIGSYDQDCVKDADNDLVAEAGTVFVTLGTGGTGQYDVSTTDPEAGYFAATHGNNLGASFGFGDFDVTPDVLTADFVRASGGSFSDAFTLTRDPNPPANQPPVPSFVFPATGLSVNFDGSGSRDPDGFVVDYAWDFGDGKTGSGAAPQHTYANGGVYDVKLTVTDDGGASASTTAQVSVTASGEQVLAADQFERTLTNAWGPADSGGTWTVSTTSGVSSVGGGVGRTTMRTAGSRPVSVLNGVSAADVDLTYQFSLDKVPTGSGARVDQSAVLRRIAGGEYRAVVRVQAGGAVRVYFNRVITGGATTVIGGDALVPGVTYAAGDVLEVRVRVAGNPADLRMKVWKAGTSEPSAWSILRSDSTTALQGPGSIGLAPYLASTATNAPVQARYDDLRAISP